MGARQTNPLLGVTQILYLLGQDIYSIKHPHEKSVITTAIKHIKCHVGLDPASRLILDPGFRQNDGFDVYCCRSNNCKSKDAYVTKNI